MRQRNTGKKLELQVKKSSIYLPERGLPSWLKRTLGTPNLSNP
jgi:hypothetical protein